MQATETLNEGLQREVKVVVPAAEMESRLMERLNEQHEQTRLLIQVHDELVLEAPTPDATAVLDTTVDVMSSAIPLSVPLKVDASVGANWLEGKS